MRGIEPRTPFLPRKCSTTELHRQACLRKQEWARLTWWAGWESNPQGQHGQRFYRPSPLPTGLPALQEPTKGFGPQLYSSLLSKSQRRDLNPQLYPPLLPKSRERDSNPRPTVYKTVALPLSYLGKSGGLCSTSQNRCPACRQAGLPLSYAGISFSCNSNNKSFIMLSFFFNL